MTGYLETVGIAFLHMLFTNYCDAALSPSLIKHAGKVLKHARFGDNRPSKPSGQLITHPEYLVCPRAARHPLARQRRHKRLRQLDHILEQKMCDREREKERVEDGGGRYDLARHGGREGGSRGWGREVGLSEYGMVLGSGQFHFMKEPET